MYKDYRRSIYTKSTVKANLFLKCNSVDLIKFFGRIWKLHLVEIFDLQTCVSSTFKIWMFYIRIWLSVFWKNVWSRSRGLELCVPISGEAGPHSPLWSYTHHSAHFSACLAQWAFEFASLVAPTQVGWLSFFISSHLSRQSLFQERDGWHFLILN